MCLARYRSWLDDRLLDLTCRAATVEQRRMKLKAKQKRLPVKW